MLVELEWALVDVANRLISLNLTNLAVLESLTLSIFFVLLSPILRVKFQIKPS